MNIRSEQVLLVDEYNRPNRTNVNIVYCLGSFPKLSQSFVLNEIYGLVQNGHKVAVCALNNPDEGIVHEEFDNLDIPISYISMPSDSDVTKNCIRFVNSLDWEPDHFHAHFAMSTRFVAMYASRYFGVPFTITAHAVDIYKEPIGGFTTKLLQSATRIVTISEYNKKYIKRNYTPNASVDIVRAGIRPEKFVPTENTEPNRILTVSRFVEKKGLPYALEAVDIATEEIPELEYHIIGSGELKPDLVNKAKQLGIDENVVFLENVSDQQLVTELDEARCFVLPCIIAKSGDRDGIPVALMEAMAMKTPPVSTTVSGIPELVDHKQNGLLTEPKNPEEISDAIVSLLEADLQWTAYAERAREKVVSEYNIEKKAEKLEATFHAAHSEK